MYKVIITLLLVVSLFINWMQFRRMQELKQEQLYNTICNEEYIN